MTDEIEEKEDTTTSARVGSFTYYDSSGKIQIRIWEDQWGQSQQNQNKRVYVDPGYVCVGGGAFVVQEGYGALLTESRPLLTKDGWEASSTDHHVANSHYLRVYAVGMRIQNISSSTLKSNVIIEAEQSSTSGHNSYAYATVPSNYHLVGGGAETIKQNFYSTFITESRPVSGNRWKAASKDHIHVSIQPVKSYAIGIRKILPNGIYLTRSQNSSSSFSSTGDGIVSATLNSGYVIVGVGARSLSYSGYGRMIYGMQPQGPRTAIAYSKDHGYVSAGNTYCDAIGLKIK